MELLVLWYDGTIESYHGVISIVKTDDSIFIQEFDGIVYTVYIDDIKEIVYVNNYTLSYALEKGYTNH